MEYFARKKLSRILALAVITGLAFILVASAKAGDPERVLYSFTDASGGGNPTGGLISDAAGNLYGTASTGGLHGCGVVFGVSLASGGGLSTIHDFGGISSHGIPDGCGPFAGVVLDKAGNLYGTTSDGGSARFGTIFRVAPGTDGHWEESVLYSFTGGHDGMQPMAALAIDAEGDLYGTAAYGGDAQGYNGSGTVFELTPNSVNRHWTFHLVHEFHGGKDGAAPFAAPALDAAGNLYGTTSSGGAYGVGMVFSLIRTSGGWKESVLHAFTGGEDGNSPPAGLVFDAAGSLYGTTSYGGNNDAPACIPNNGAPGCGTVFKLTPVAAGWKFSVLHAFSGSDGRSPDAGLIFDSAGNLYGNTFSGGINGGGGAGNGLVFELTPSPNGGWTVRVLYVFSGVSDGAVPSGNVALDAYGNVYGTTYTGGISGINGAPLGYGVLFEVSP
jgi:uncharacterized repeat protein (TIGR03803 family)